MPHSLIQLFNLFTQKIYGKLDHNLCKQNILYNGVSMVFLISGKSFCPQSLLLAVGRFPQRREFETNGRKYSHNIHKASRIFLEEKNK